LRKLVRDGRLRAERGAAARRSVLDAHAGAGWSQRLEALYETARSVGAADLDEYPQQPRDADYAAMVLAFAAPLDSTVGLPAAAAPLGPQVEGLAYDLVAVSARAEGRSLTVRISQGWEHRPEWTRRLLALARAHPWLAVSLPFAAGDDVDGSSTVALLTSLLELDGSTLSDCGDISLDVEAPAAARASGGGEVALTDDALDTVEEFLASPHWRSSAESRTAAA
jgi:hypothetical protein